MQNALIENFLHIDDMLVEPNGKAELKKFAKISKEKEELQNKKEKNKQADMFKQLFDPKGDEDCDIALMTGCTAHCCIIDENQKKLYFANAGDSRGVLCKNGVAYEMSEDHKPDLETEKSRIYKADGWVSDGRVKGRKIIFLIEFFFNFSLIFLGNLNLSRSLGDLDYKQNKKLPAKEQMITAYPECKLKHCLLTVILLFLLVMEFGIV
jgi:serine/threonine protein phosphatase PrpC